MAGIGEPLAGDDDGSDADGEVDQGIAEKVIARMRIIEAGRAGCSVGARKIGAAAAAGNCERLCASVLDLLKSNHSIPQSCKMIYNDGWW